MKKAILPILLLVFVTSGLLALESEPSSTVGFIKYSVNRGMTKFCLPFTFYKLNAGSLVETMTMDDVVGTQMSGAASSLQADRIVNLYNGSFVWYKSTTSTWQPANSAFLDNVPYQFKHTPNTIIDVYLAGTVVKEVQNVGNFVVGRKYAALREAGSIPRENLDLHPGTVGGFTGASIALQSDELINPLNGNFTWYKTTNSTWQGSFTATIPGVPVNVLVRSGHAGFTWTYDPTSRSSEAPATRNSARN
jgi:hypothetical protein